MIDIVRRLIGLQTIENRLKTEAMVRGVASQYNVDVDVLVAVIKAESGMNPHCITRNKNGTTDYGLCQFNDHWYRDIIDPQVALTDPVKSVHTMCERWEKGHQNDWLAYRNKSYIKYL